MINLRRIYVYLVSAITLQAVVWAIIALLRNLTAGSLTDATSQIALQISMIIVGLPLFLVHWLWAQRSAARDEAERGSAVRRLFLNGMLFAFIIPFANSTRLFAESLILRIVGPSLARGGWVSELRFSLIAMLVVAVFGFYFYQIRKQDDQAVGREESTVILDQVFLYLLALTGLGLTVYGTVEILRQLLESIFVEALRLGQWRTLASSIANVVAGLPLWIAAWREAQKRFAGNDKRERYSAVRKIYLYLLLFLSALTAVTTATILLANFLMRLLNVPSAGGGFFRALSVILVSLVVWSYHAYVLRQDVAVAEAASEAAVVRRIYLYLISGVGLSAVLVGFGGVLSVLIRALDGASLGPDLREQLAWFTATLAAGLPLWLVNWRRIMLQASQPEPVGIEERSSFVRRFYLYFFLFVAVLTLLGGTVYVVSQLVELALGSRSSAGLLSDIGQALAYSVMAIAVLVYHGMLLRDDQRFVIEQQIKEQRTLDVVVVDARNGRLGQALVEALQQRLPGISVHPLPLTEKAKQVMGDGPTQQTQSEILLSAEIIVAPWQMAVAGALGGVIDAEMAEAFNQSSAQKLLLPLPQKNVAWIGADLMQEKGIVRDVSEAVETVSRGKKLSDIRRMSATAMAVLAIISLCALTMLVPLVIQIVVLLLEGPS